MATFYVENFGCRATQADGAAIERQFQELGWDRAAAPASAAVVILNTCTVTAAADQDARAAVRRIHRKNPKAQIVVTGCYAQRAPEEVAALPGVTSVVGNSHKHRLAKIGLQTSGFGLQPFDLDGRADAKTFVSISQLASNARGPKSDARSPIFVSDIFAHTELLAAPVFDASNERTRPNLKVQDGCDNRCSFCVIPYVRGQSRSLPLAEIVREVEALVAAGYREVVISGINLGRWGRDLQAQGGYLFRFEDLVGAILRETALQKLRISSVEPMDWTDELIQLVSTSPRIAKHAHVPLQSGSDAVLRRMHRKYRPWHYREKIEKIRTAMPSAAIGADVMTGFPGETQIEFEETLRLVEELPLTYLHVFTYSARPGTPAANMAAQVPTHIARERNRVLRDLASGKKTSFMNNFVGQTVEAITLNVKAIGRRSSDERNNDGQGDKADGNYTEALTDNYLPMRLEGNHPPNRWIAARVEKMSDGVLLAIAA